MASLRWWSWRPWLQASRLCWTSSTGFQSSPSTRSLSTNGRSEDLGPFSILWLLSQNLSQDLNGTNFLGLVFQDPARWGLAFESLVGSLECRISERRTLRPWPKITKRQRQWHTQWLGQWQISECRSPWPWLRSTWPITTVRRVFSSIRSRW